MVELKKIRKEKHLSCKEMAEMLKISKPFYWQIENKKRRLSYPMAMKIAYILGTKPDKLFYDEFKDELSEIAKIKSKKN